MAEPKLTVGRNLPQAKKIILVGTLGKSSVTDKLVQEKKLAVTVISGKWEVSVGLQKIVIDTGVKQGVMKLPNLRKI